MGHDTFHGAFPQYPLFLIPAGAEKRAVKVNEIGKKIKIHTKIFFILKNIVLLQTHIANKNRLDIGKTSMIPCYWCDRIGEGSHKLPATQ